MPETEAMLATPMVMAASHGGHTVALPSLGVLRGTASGHEYEDTLISYLRQDTVFCHGYELFRHPWSRRGGASNTKRSGVSMPIKTCRAGGDIRATPEREGVYVART